MTIDKGEKIVEIYNKRAIQTLKFFIKNKKPLTGEQIGVYLGVSSRTVRNDMKELNSYLVEYEMKIISRSGEGYTLESYSEEKYDKMTEMLTQKDQEKILTTIIPSNSQDRVGYIMSKLLMLSLDASEKIEFYDLEEELCVGTSTLKKDFRIVDKILKKYDLRISITKKSGVRIVGDETKIRYCISEHVFNNTGMLSFEENPFYKEIFSEEDVKIIGTILKNTIMNYSLRLSDTAFKNLETHILIMLKRYEHAGSIVYREEIMKSFSYQKEYCCAKEIANEIYSRMKVDIGDEVYYITQHLMSSQRFLKESEGHNGHYQGTLALLKRIKEQTGIDLSDDELLITGLSTHLGSALQRLRFDMNIRNDVLDVVKSSYPLAFELAVLAGKIIAEDYKLQMRENEIGYMAIHFAVALGKKGLSTEERVKTAIIVCGSGHVTAMLMKEKIQQVFSNRIEIIQMSSAQELTQAMIDSVDFVFTTVRLDGLYSDKIKRVKVFLDDNDISDIAKMITDNNQEVNFNFREIVREDLFFTDLQFKDREAVLHYLTDIMIEKNYITEKIKESIFVREEMSTTELGCLVAIPHALLNDMEDATVAVAILKKPIVWEQEKVQVVLVISIPKSKKELWEVMFRRLYCYLIEGSGVTRLIKNKSYAELISSLEQLTEN